MRGNSPLVHHFMPSALVKLCKPLFKTKPCVHYGLIFLSSLYRRKSEYCEKYNINIHLHVYICMWVYWTIDEWSVQLHTDRPTYAHTYAARCLIFVSKTFKWRVSFIEIIEKDIVIVFSFMLITVKYFLSI